MSTSTESISPSWLNDQFLETALSSEGDSDVTVICKSVKPATASGDNYLSQMFRVVVKILRRGRKEEKSIIVKTLPLKEMMLKIAFDGHLFKKEISMFRDILPAMYSLLEKVSGEYQRFGAQYIYSLADSQQPVIMLEDLKTLDFVMAERLNGLDMEHCLLVLRCLARFHATSLALREMQPNIFQLFTTTIFCEEMRSNLEAFFTNNIKKLAEEVEKWPEYNERFAAKLHKLAENAMDIWINSVAMNEKEFNVLAHGDLWMNNIMFRYSDGTDKVQDVRFVDFQLSYWTSPTVDLLYFLNSSPTVSICEKYDVFIGEYHKTLGETLKNLGFERLQPPLEQLHEELDKRGAFGAVAGIAVRVVVQVDRSSVPDMDKVLKDGETVHFSEAYKDAMKKLLPFYEQRGWL